MAVYLAKNILMGLISRYEIRRSIGNHLRNQQEIRNYYYRFPYPFNRFRNKIWTKTNILAHVYNTDKSFFFPRVVDDSTFLRGIKMRIPV
jgi:hypothetical protein